ncbi:hypothetical protein DITRI_Ditri14bG0110600 [Diplodiscus trichospermus]
MWTKFSETVIKLWNGWEIRALVLLSLSLQVMLIALGSQRKRQTNIWIGLVVWSAYMAADWVATVALGILARTPAEDSGNHTPEPNDSLQSFWAPFLLLHLGGPDTITAYSLEDNELWPRHLLGLVVETGVALYVLYRSWDYSALMFIAIPVFIAGIIKYGERTWVLRSSSAECFRKSLLSAPDPGPDYVEFIKRKKEEFVEVPLIVLPPKEVKPTDDLFCRAYYLFERFKYLFADLILGKYERQDCHSIISKMSAENAFHMVEVELGFLYDVLYTKATIVYTWYGILLRCISFLSSVFALITFIIIIDKHAYSPIEISITYILLVGAVVLEIYALIKLIYSDWTNLWLALHNESFRKVVDANRWSRNISKYNLLEVCLKEEPSTWIKVQKLLGIHETLEKHQNVTWQDVDDKMEDMIFRYLRDKSQGKEDVNLCKEFLKSRGKNVIEENFLKVKEENSLKIKDLEWSTVEVEFDHSLLLWHIATDICYYADSRIENDYCRKVSKCLSDYMLYLLVMCPKMLPKGIGELRYRDTCAEAIRFFKQKRAEIETNVDKACKMLFQVDAERSLLEEVKGDRTKSVLFYGITLAKQLQSLNNLEFWGYEIKWEMMSKIWIELLCYAAVNCGWKEHAQQLRKGGELLTHVSLLMAHLGLSDQYQVQKQYVLQVQDPSMLFTELLFDKNRRFQCFRCLFLDLFCIPHCCDQVSC